MGGARLVARVPHTHLVPKGHGLVRVLRCDVCHILQTIIAGFCRLGLQNDVPILLLMKLAPKHLKEFRCGGLRGGVSHPAITLRRTLAVTIIPVTFASVVGAPGAG